MKKKECPSCAMKIDAKSKVCEICNYEFPDHSRGLKWAAFLLAVFLLLLYLFVVVDVAGG